MAEIKNGNCSCYDCEKKRVNEQKHLDHPFYKKVEDVTAEVAKEQILKGAAKYPEPFNPDSWTNVELVQHQLQELRDAQVYSVGLLDRLEKQTAAYNDLIKNRNNWADIAKEKEEKLIEAKIAIEDKERAYNSLLKDYEIAKQEAEYWRLRAIKENGQGVNIAIPKVKITVDPPKIDNKKLFNDIKKALGENLDAQG